MAQLQANLGDTVVAQIDGHSPQDGAIIPEGSTVALTSNDPTVATVPASVTVPAGGAQSLPGIPITLVAKGSTDLTADVTTPDGTPYHAAVTLVLAEVVPGLVSISLTLTDTTTGAVSA